jgi:hypothetical protein
MKRFMKLCGAGDLMRVAGRIRLGVALAALTASTGAVGQAAIVAPSGRMVMVSSTGPDAVTMQATGEVVREIDDPHTGARWLLMRDSSHPGGPGRMVLAFAPRDQALSKFDGEMRIGVKNDLQPLLAGSAPAQPVIRAGDRLTVEENTAVVEARLEAVALNPAAIGSPLNVRLAIGGRVVRVVAVAAGRAALLAETEARP